MLDLIRLCLLDVFRLTSALAGFWLVADYLKVRKLRYLGFPTVLEDPLLTTRKMAQVGLFGIIAGIPIFLQDRLELFERGRPIADVSIMVAWGVICATLVERSVRRAVRLRLAAYAYAGFMLSLFVLALIQRG